MDIQKSPYSRYKKLYKEVEYIAGSLANGDLRDVVPLEEPPGDNLRATKWSSKVSRR